MKIWVSFQNYILPGTGRQYLYHHLVYNLIFFSHGLTRISTEYERNYI